ncbi:MAG TPA: PDZ domain-containing protein, partial [Longimicrobiaceae bacterium]|nr:PDZ domain-containing protein [Longimicrobiaceae bacterium]
MMMRRNAFIATLAAVLAGLGGSPAGAQDPRPPEPPMVRGERIIMLEDTEMMEPPSRGWIGVAFDWRDDGPVVVRDVLPESPAARAGVVRGDTLVRLNGQAARGETVRRLRVEPGDTLRLHLRRGGRERQVRVVAKERGGEVIILRRGDREHTLDVDSVRDRIRLRVDTIGAHLDSLFTRLDSARVRLRHAGPDRVVTMRLDSVFERGMLETLPFSIEVGSRALAGAEFTQMNPGLGRYFGTEEGLLALRVAPGSPAARAGIEAGDVVTRVDGREVETLADLRQAVFRSPDEEVRLEVLRQRQRREVTLRWERPRTLRFRQAPREP